jgi:AcrR family transcriptional regulator
VAYRRSPAVQERLDAARARVVDAALALVAEGGWSSASVAAVAARAGVATGSVYQHVPGKGELLAEVFRLASGREVEAVGAALERPGTTAERAAAGVETFVRRAFRAPRLAYALIAEPVDPRVEAERLVFRAAYRDRFAGLIADAAARGDLPPQDPTTTAAAVVGAIAEAVVVPLHHGDLDPHDDATADRTVAELTALVVRALGATP